MLFERFGYKTSSGLNLRVNDDHYLFVIDIKNKNDNIHKNKVQNFKKSDDQINIFKYRVTANITEYHNISKLIFRIIIIPKFIMLRQLFHVKKAFTQLY